MIGRECLPISAFEVTKSCRPNPRISQRAKRSVENDFGISTIEQVTSNKLSKADYTNRQATRSSSTISALTACAVVVEKHIVKTVERGEDSDANVQRQHLNKSNEANYGFAILSGSMRLLIEIMTAGLICILLIFFILNDYKIEEIVATLAIFLAGGLKILPSLNKITVAYQ